MKDKQLVVVTTPDSILNLLRDYTKGAIPSDALPHDIGFYQNEKGLIGIRYKTNDPSAKNMEVKFNLKQMNQVEGV